MTRPRGSAVVLVAASLALAGCFSEADVPPAPAAEATTPAAEQAPAPGVEAAAPPPDLGPAASILDDAEGDAVEYNHEYATRNAERCRVAGDAAAAACAETLGDAYRAAEPTGGLPAPPDLDVVELRVAESPTTVRLTLVVADLASDLAAVALADGSKAGAWGVCWGDRERGPQCASLEARRLDGVLVADARLVHWSGECNDWWYCAWGIPSSMEPGSPDLVHLDVPRDLLEDPAVLARPAAVTQRLEYLPDEPRWSLAGPHAAGGRVPDEWSRYHTDLARLDADHALATPFAGPPAPAAARIAFADPAGDEAERPDLDILAVEVAETATTFTVSHRLATVAADPAPHTLSVAVGAPSGRMLVVDLVAGPDGRAASAWTCADPDCDKVVEPAVDVAVVEGSPGWVNVTLQRSDLGDPAPGDRLTFLASAASAEHRYTSAVGPVTLSAESGRSADWTGAAPVYRFGS